VNVDLKGDEVAVLLGATLHHCTAGLLRPSLYRVVSRGPLVTMSLMLRSSCCAFHGVCCSSGRCAQTAQVGAWCQLRVLQVSVAARLLLWPLVLAVGQAVYCATGGICSSFCKQ
jgi:hypothetical protein